VAQPLSYRLQKSVVKRLHGLGEFLQAIPLPPAPPDAPNTKVEFVHRACALSKLVDYLAKQRVMRNALNEPLIDRVLGLQDHRESLIFRHRLCF
jgi:hypothetical protein